MAAFDVIAQHTNHGRYVVSASVGVAFNGLMETGHAWPNYLDQDRWRALVAGGFRRPLPPWPRGGQHR
jgi:hypothetical protein